MEREKLTVLIPTYNEERNLASCLDTVNWADELLVVDSYSTDQTLEIARAYGCRIIQHKYINSAAQKNWAIPQATHPWVLIVDADERVTPELRDEIQQLLARGLDCKGYRIKRLNHFLGRRIRFCGWQRDDVLRLFQRDRSRYQERHVHADVMVQGSVGRLRGRLLHYTFQSFEQYLRKFDQYTSWAARDRQRRTQRVGVQHLVGRPLWRFFRQYVLYLGVLDGIPGLIVCSLAAYSVFLKYAKLWELQQRK